MSYTICQEMGHLTLVHYTLTNSNRFVVATNDVKKFTDKKSAITYARTMLKHWPDLKLYVMGPRKGQTRVKSSKGHNPSLAPCLLGRGTR